MQGEIKKEHPYNEDARDAFQELKDCEKLDIQIKKHREKRRERIQE